MRISDWSSDVCSSDLHGPNRSDRSSKGRRRRGFRDRHTSPERSDSRPRPGLPTTMPSPEAAISTRHALASLPCFSVTNHRSMFQLAPKEAGWAFRRHPGGGSGLRDAHTTQTKPTTKHGAGNTFTVQPATIVYSQKPVRFIYEARRVGWE